VSYFLSLNRKIGNLLGDPIVSYSLKYFFVILAFLDHFIYEKERFVSITSGEIWVPKQLVGFRELEAMRNTIWLLGCDLLECDEIAGKFFADSSLSLWLVSIDYME
jgi:hypothetical protein